MNIRLDNIQNDSVILRCDLNEPVKDDKVTSTKRIGANINSIFELLAKGCRITIISHHSKESQSLEPAYNYIKNILLSSALNLSEADIEFLKTIDINVVEKYLETNKSNLPKILVLENTRLFLDQNNKSADEEMDDHLINVLKKSGNAFVFDAFSVAHRDHATTIGLASALPSCLGHNARLEYGTLKELVDEVHESIFIMGGAKISTKLPVIKNLLNKNATIFLGGAMVHNILKAEGVDIKDSYHEELAVDDILINNTNVILPAEYVWQKREDRGGKSIERIVDSIVDIKKLNKIITDKKIKNIMWNGPFGIFEEGETKGTDKIADYVQKSTLKTVVGGGDTLTYVENYNKNSQAEFKCSYISLSGGAMLEFLSGKKLSVIELLK